MASKYALTLAPTENRRNFRRLLLVPCDYPYDISKLICMMGINCSPNNMPKMMNT